MSDKKTILEEAIATVEIRREQYGDTSPHFAAVARAWEAYISQLRYPISARDVCNLMVILKTIRDGFRNKRDNLVDIAGYARCAEIVSEQHEAPSVPISTPEERWEDQRPETDDVEQRKKEFDERLWATPRIGDVQQARESFAQKLGPYKKEFSERHVPHTSGRINHFPGVIAGETEQALASEVCDRCLEPAHQGLCSDGGMREDSLPPGHDSRDGPCCCGTWHKPGDFSEPPTAPMKKIDVAAVLADVERERDRRREERLRQQAQELDERAAVTKTKDSHGNSAYLPPKEKGNK